MGSEEAMTQSEIKKKETVALNKKLRRHFSISSKKEKTQSRYLIPENCIKLAKNNLIMDSPKTIHYNTPAVMSPVISRSQDEDLHHYLLRHNFEMSLRSLSENYGQENELSSLQMKSAVSEQVIHGNSTSQSEYNSLQTASSNLLKSNNEFNQSSQYLNTEDRKNSAKLSHTSRCTSLPSLKITNADTGQEIKIKSEKSSHRSRRKKLLIPNSESSSRRNSFMAYIVHQVGLFHLSLFLSRLKLFIHSLENVSNLTYTFSL